MFENVPIIKRWKFIIGGIGMVFLVSILYALQVSDMHTRVRELERKTAVVQDADMEIVNRQVRLKELGDQIRALQPQARSMDTHIALMQYIERACSELQLQMIQLPKETLENVQGYDIANVDLSVQGDFHAILRLIYRIEAVDRVATVSRSQLLLRDMRIAEDRQELLIATLQLSRLVESRSKSNSM